MFTQTGGPGNARRPFICTSYTSTAKLIAQTRILAVLALALLLQPACTLRGHKSDLNLNITPAPLRIAVLPFNAPPNASNLRRTSLALQAMMAEVGHKASFLEIIPFWETVPAAIQVAGAARYISPEAAVELGGRLKAKWVARGGLRPGKEGVVLELDFIPMDNAFYPFRFAREGSLESLEQSLPEAIEQFYRFLYFNAKPPDLKSLARIDAESLRQTAEALDREYGWFAPANPGKSQNVVEKLQRSDERLARTLFDPQLYSLAPERRPVVLPEAKSALQSAPAAKAVPLQSAPAVSMPPGKVSAQAAPVSRAAQPVTTVNPPASFSLIQPTSAPPPTYTPPPPKRFTQKLDLSAKAGPLEAPSPPKVVAATARQDSRTTKGSPRVAAAAKEPTASETKTSTSAFGIQVGAVRSKAEAEEVVARLARAGSRAEIEAADLKEKGIWYRLRIYGFESREAAVSAGRKLLSAGLIKAFWPVP